MAEPTSKEVPVEEFIKELFGFDRRTSIRANVCFPAPVGCGQPVTGFKDEISEREFRISGLCQACQDRIFNYSEE